MSEINLKDYTISIEEVMACERQSINAWRNHNGRTPLPDASNEPIATGVAISGGGIRSASFALGALQALDQNLTPLAVERHTAKAAKRSDLSGVACIDYLSTVSGGGYIGTSLRAGMEKLNGAFPFMAGTGDKSDNLAVGHIRNYSRYLLPRGLPDLIGSIAVVLRGLVVNVVFILSVILVLAGLTGWANPNQAAYAAPDFFGLEGFPYPPLVLALGTFAYTKIAIFLTFAGLFLWGLFRSIFTSKSSEFQGFGYKVARRSLYAIALLAFIEFQPFAITALFRIYGNQAVTGWQGVVSGWIATLTPYFAPLAAIAAMASRLFGDTLKTNQAETGLVPFAKRFGAKVVFAFIALVLPLTIWVIYLHFSLVTDIGYNSRNALLQSFVGWACGAPDIGTGQSGVKACESTYLISSAFVCSGFFLLAIMLLLAPNANSLHRLYRDRLSRAFLFDPTGSKTLRSDVNAADPAEIGSMAFKELRSSTGPLHLVNTAINLQGSETLNRRGRNADFFFFSPAYCGSSSTGYIKTGTEAITKELPDLGTAMAVSGAAASSNMGNNSIRGLAPTLALLNIRLGYWMKNPRFMSATDGEQASTQSKGKASTGFYLIEEMFGFLDENSSNVYLTDGGHIENLGLYELLRRRCKTILVIDAEADPQMTFGSLVLAQRYARLDLGIRINLPWQAIAEASKAVNEAYQSGQMPDKAACSVRPHCAIGSIDYGDGQTGTLIYVKSSLTGDENDYIRDYKMRNPAFPHETTGDQFFSEEQFEVYRALGFHALNSAFTGKAPMARLPENEMPGLDSKGKGIAKIGRQTLERKSIPQPKLADYF